jgi:hypothetical protein
MVRFPAAACLCSALACAPADVGGGADTRGSSTGGEPPGTTTSPSVPTTSSSSAGDETTTSSADASSAGGEVSSSSDEGPVDLGCDAPMFEQLGEVKVVEHGDSYWSAMPLPSGASFDCLRFEFDVQTVDSQQAILDMYEGCPIFLGIASLGGQGPEGAPLASMLFKPWKVGCTPGPDRVELDTFADATVQEGPWPLGGAYHVRIEVDLAAATSSVALSQDGAQVGPTVSAAITGANHETARDPRVGLGMTQPAGDAYFPDYGAVYSNVRVTAALSR